MNHKMWAQWKDFRLDEDYEEPDVMEQLLEVLKIDLLSFLETLYIEGFHQQM